MIRSAVLSPTGVRAAFEARGEIFTVPAEKGQPRNLTQSSGAHDRSPAWSPDGREIAWLSDASGEYQLMIGEQTGVTKPRAIPLPRRRSSPRRSGRPTEAAPAPGQPSQPVGDRRRERQPRRRSTPTPTMIRAGASSRVVAGFAMDRVSKSLDSHLRAIFLYSLADKKAHQVTDGLSDADRAGVRRGRQVSLFPREHQLRAAHQLARDELGRPARHACRLSRGARARASRRRCCRRPVTSRVGGAAGDGGKPAPPPPVRVDIKGIVSGFSRWVYPPATTASLRRARPERVLHWKRRDGGGQAPLNLHRYQLASAGRHRFSKASVVHAVGRRQEAALSRRRQSLGRRRHRSSGQGGRGRDRRRRPRSVGRSARRVGADLPRDLADPARVLLRREDARRRLAGRL